MLRETTVARRTGGAAEYHAVWAESWDREEDCADGQCRDCGAFASLAAARLRLALSARLARVEGWPGRGYVADGQGRLVEEVWA